MKRALITCLLTIVCLAWVPTLAAAPRPAPLNFVFFLIDDMGWTDLGCYGSPFYKTPHIDDLARKGMRFTDAYAAGPVCSPTRASIMTGRHPARLHLTDWLPGRRDLPAQKLARPVIRQQLPLAEITLAEALKSAGYVSAHVGKWHLGGEGFWPEQQGFDVNIAGDHTGTPLSYFAPFKSGNRFMPQLEQAESGEYLTDRLTTEAEQFLERTQGKPFFLYFSHYAVHIPLKAKAEVIARYTQAAPGAHHTNAIYAAMIESVDDCVGRLVRKLEQLGLEKRTVIFFTSDNGGLSVREGPYTPATSNHPLRAGKGYLYEGGIREPLLVKWPGVVRPGSVCATPVSSVDFFPTILEMADVKPDPAVPLDGVSLVPLLKEAGPLSRDALYWHYPHYSNQGGKPGSVIRAGDYKLIEFFEDNHIELYRLRDDLGERQDLASQMPDKATELKARLAAWRQAVNAQMMTPNPDYRPAEAQK